MNKLYDNEEILARLPEVHQGRQLVFKRLQFDMFLSSTEIDWREIYYIGAPNNVLYYCWKEDLFYNVKESWWIEKNIEKL